MTRAISTREIADLIASGTTNLYVRYSRGPKADQNGTSTDWAKGESHAEFCLSAENLIPQTECVILDVLDEVVGVKWTPDLAFFRAYGPTEFLEMQLNSYRFLEASGARAWILKATRVGTDSDGAPMIDSRTFETVGYWEGK